MATHIESVDVESEEEALVFMVHHLQIAARYFEGTPKVIPVDSIRSSEFSFPAIVAWVQAMEGLYPNE